jgi:predicted metalloprotease with PDZ domain
MNRITYELTGFDLDAHEFEVCMRLPGPVEAGQLFSLPAWIPGSYMIRDFARNITEIAAFDELGQVSIEKLDKQTWKLAECQGAVRVQYKVYAFDLSVRSAFLDQTRAYFNGTSLFLLAAGREAGGWLLRIAPPRHPAAADWEVATTLPAHEVDSRGFGSYTGETYSRLVDCPVEIAAFSQTQFAVQGIPHRVVVSDGGRFDLSRVSDDLAEICAEHAAMFGELPIDRYLFLTLASADGYGGLEHLDSTSLMCKRSDLPAPGLESPDKGYRQFLGLCSHEYFHLWNVKRIRPERMAKADLSREVHTELLWAFEGITSYYDELALARSGVLPVRDYLDLFATTVSRVLRSPGRARQSVAESSFDAWTKFYKQDENAPNAIVSYYAKGALVAFGLDLALRRHSDGKLSLDDLMRRLWQQFGKTGRGIPERGIEREVEALLGDPLDSFFASFVYGTDELPLAEWFAEVGIGYRMRAPANTEDLGGYRDQASGAADKPVLGARFTAEQNGLRLSQVIAGGPAQAAGLAPADLLIAIDEQAISAENVGDLLTRAADATAQVYYFRRGLLRQSRIQVRPAAADTCDLWLMDDDQMSPIVAQARNAWLASNRADVR